MMRRGQKNMKVFEIMETTSQKILATFLDERYAFRVANDIYVEIYPNVHVHERYRPIVYVIQHINEIIMEE